ncbi:hypothetical protein BGX21_003901 [Mortierella sp. AD011]|nr:hypothetical protein BGX20_006141 [Mortierella sp. AD010]KAF9404013.1 hypothetical protein BGX21_003901 [Mortierella sp. AD011]
MPRLSDPLVQIIILGFLCFCCPGMFNALQGTGAYGLAPKDSDIGNHASIALSLVFAISSLFAGALFNVVGHRALLIIGGFAYPLYISSFLAYAYIESIVFVVVASCLLGVGAGWLWCAQGAMMMGYPEEGEKGMYFSIFWAIFNCGGVLGNVVPLAIQWNDPINDLGANTGDGGASTNSYIGYMSVMVVGMILSLFLLPSNKVIRRDGSHVIRIKYLSPITELKSVFYLFRDWRMLCLVPMFFTSNWVYTYQFTGVNALNFSPRSRNMNSMFYWLSQIISSILFGSFLDRAEWSRPKRARSGLILLAILLIGTWCGGIIFQSTFGPTSAILNKDGVYVKNPADFHAIDLVRNPREYIGPFFLYIAYGCVDAMYQGYSYWLMGALTNDTSQAARFAGFYKFVQNLGSVLAPVVQTSVIGNGPSDGYNALHATGNGMGEIIVCVALVFTGVLGAIPVAFRAVKDHTFEIEEEISDELHELEVEDLKA